jgi:hypothetical protein
MYTTYATICHRILMNSWKPLGTNPCISWPACSRRLFRRAPSLFVSSSLSSFVDSIAADTHCPRRHCPRRHCPRRHCPRRRCPCRHCPRRCPDPSLMAARVPCCPPTLFAARRPCIPFRTRCPCSLLTPSLPCLSYHATRFPPPTTLVQRRFPQSACTPVVDIAMFFPVHVYATILQCLSYVIFFSHSHFNVFFIDMLPSLFVYHSRSSASPAFLSQIFDRCNHRCSLEPGFSIAYLCCSLRSCNIPTPTCCVCYGR